MPEIKRSSKKIIVSASRRQDIPAYRLTRLLDQVKEGCFRWTQPYSGKEMTLTMKNHDILSIVLWSKDFGPYLASPRASSILEPMNPYFIFTINDSPELEPGLQTSLDERIEQAARIIDQYGEARLLWRFDPIVHWITPSGEFKNNLEPFDFIAEKMAALGVTRCVFSFAQIYGKVIKRQKKLGIRFIDPDMGYKLEKVRNMADFAMDLGITLMSCCQPELVKAHQNVVHGACIDGRHVAETFGVDPNLVDTRPHPSRKGCGCTKSIDIGSYEPCPNSCTYCYANPV
ncbi:MAG: DUF1848 domain-containing protein [Deltaproteobacteria bacterium]|nr:DUF1848 domain-containing protein [Deltaproteobacteria bacterium]